jgi:hypothetical protein
MGLTNTVRVKSDPMHDPLTGLTWYVTEAKVEVVFTKLPLMAVNEVPAAVPVMPGEEGAVQL